MTSWWKGSDIRSVIDALLQTITRPQSLLPKGRGTMRRYTFRPSLEVLEQRTVLTTISQYGSLQAAVGAGSGVTPNYNSESRNNPLSLSYSNSVADPTSGATGSYTVSTNASFSGSVNSWTGNMAGTGTMQYPPHNGGGGYAAGSQITIAVDTSETFQFTYNISESAPAPNFQTDAGVEIVKNLGASQLEILANITMGSGSYSVEIDPGNIYTIGCGVNFQSDPNIGQYTNSASMSWQLLPLTPAVTPTTTTISASPNPSAFGQPASFTASVSPTNSSQLTPTGTVTFMDGSTALNPGGTPLNASGTAIFAPSTMLTIGTHSITAVYSGDNNFSGSTSSPVLQTVAYTPSQISTAYGIGSIAVNQEWPQNISANGAGQTIAIIAYNDDPNIANDLSTFDSQFGLPQFNTGAQGSPMFAVVNQYDHSVSGNSSSPDYVAPDPPGTQRSLEEAMDVEWAHAIAPGASIVLIEINPSGNDVTDESWAFSTVNGLANGTLTVPNMPAIPKVSVASMSYGDVEGGATYPTSTMSALTPYFNGTGVTYLAASGDYGTPGIYPAYSPNVIAVGGTTLTQNSNGSYSETGWSLGSDSYNRAWASGGGTSTINAATGLPYESEPSYQQGVQNTGARAIPDVSFDADPNSGVCVYDSFGTALNGTPSWAVGSGTSLATPCWAGLIAIVDQGRVAAGGTPLTGYDQTLPALYNLALAGRGDFHNGLGGNNGSSTAGLTNPTLYNEVTGLGTAVANQLVPDLVNYGRTSTKVTSSANSSVYGQSLTFTATVRATVSLVVPPTGTVIFYDGQTQIGSGTLTSVNGVDYASISTSSLALATHSITAVYAGDSNYLPSTSAALSQTVNAMTSSNLQNVLAQSIQSGTPVTIEADPTQPGSLTTILTAENGLQSPGSPITLSIDLDGGTYADQTVSTPSDVNLVIKNGKSVGASPALTETGGQVELLNCSLSTVTNAPTILLTGGSLSLSGDIVQESTSFTDAAIAMTGGTLDLGTVTSPGGNVLNINGTGEFVHNTTGNSVPTTGDTFEDNGTALTAPSLSFTSLATTAASTVVGQSVTLTATVTPDMPGSATPTGSVDFYDTTTDTDLGSVTLSGGVATLNTSALGLGTHLIQASYGGDSNYLLSLDSLTQVVVLPPLSVVSAATLSALQGETTGSVLLAAFTQGNATQLASAYTATVAWGDGLSATSTEASSPISIQVSGQIISVYGIHTYTTRGTQNLSVTLSTTGTSAEAYPTATVSPNVSSQISSSSSGLVYNRATQLFGGTITLMNTGTNTLVGTLVVELSGLPTGVTVNNASGTAPDGNPYILVSLPDGFLAPGKSVTFTVYFRNPKLLSFNYGLITSDETTNG